MPSLSYPQVTGCRARIYRFVLAALTVTTRSGSNVSEQGLLTLGGALTTFFGRSVLPTRQEVERRLTPDIALYLVYLYGAFFPRLVLLGGAWVLGSRRFRVSPALWGFGPPVLLPSACLCRSSSLGPPLYADVLFVLRSPSPCRRYVCFTSSLVRHNARLQGNASVGCPILPALLPPDIWDSVAYMWRT